MIEIDDQTTIDQAFFAAAKAFGDRPFLCAPVNPQRSWHPAGYEIDYKVAAAEVRRLMSIYGAAGLG
ncbi:MAG: hypothetical protein ABSG76_22845, partial [Xanthobacteraceae bacterium]